MLKKAFALLVMSAALSVAAPAQAKSNYSLQHIYTQCGIGGLIFGRISPVLAVISNVTWDLGTTAALSDSLSPNLCGGQIVARAVFIKENFPSIEQDLASGRGEHLTALNGLMACPAANSHIRDDYAHYTLSPAYQQGKTTENSEELFQIVNDNLEAAHCSIA
ncbi:DUF3015 family protein [Aquirhabdus sp.]|uniref:DUF3015 family protein n=1 Tax=Aquirhabdus sp. TaxID=2824160 RepID=UPI00396CCB56